MAEMKVEGCVDPIRALRTLYAEKLSPLFAEMEIGLNALSESKLKSIKELFKQKAWNIDLQAYNVLGFAVSGGIAQIGSGLAASASMTGLEKTLKAVGDVLPAGGQISKTFIESDTTLLEADLTQLSQHRQPAIEKTRQQISNAESKIGEKTSQLGHQQDALFRVTK